VIYGLFRPFEFRGFETIRVFRILPYGRYKIFFIIRLKGKNGKTQEKQGEFTTLEKVKFTFDMFFPKLIVGYQILDSNGRVLAERGSIN